jgi:hypothetical protein
VRKCRGTLRFERKKYFSPKKPIIGFLQEKPFLLPLSLRKKPSNVVISGIKLKIMLVKIHNTSLEKM